MQFSLLRRHPVAHAVVALLSTQAIVAVAAENQEERIVVTGTHIKRIDQETASPVVVIDRTAIEGSGASSISELLQMSAFNGAGTFNEAFTSGFTPGAAAFDLRGFGPERTLVLVNGKRQPIYPFGAGGSKAFVDLNSIPLATVKRVEILKDGASALYGSDAVAGVINIITYERFDGTEVNLRGKAPVDGGAETGSLSVLTGGESGKWIWLVGAEASQREELLGADRDYARSLRFDFGDLGVVDGRSTVGGTAWQRNLATNEVSVLGNCAAADTLAASLLNPAFTGNFCAYDFAGQSQLLPESDRFSFDSHVKYDFGWANVSFSYGLVGVDTRSTGFFTSTPAFAQNDTVDGVNYRVVRRLTELGTPTIETDSATQHLAMDWNWQLGEFEFTFSAYQSKNEIDEELSEGWLHIDDYSRLAADVANGTVSLRNRLTAAQVADYTDSFWHSGESSVAVQEMRVSGPLIDTTLGPIWLAAGAEHRKEDFFDRSEQAILDGNVVGYGTSGAEGDRQLNAAYVETAIPLSERAELSLSVRQDDYNDFGSSTNPKIGFRLNPAENWLFRASWGTGFRAPGLHQLYTNLNIGSAGARPFVQSGNPDLQPEESESLVLGVLVEPASGSEVSLDIWSIDVDNIVSNLGAATIERLCVSNPTPPAFCAGRVLAAGEVFTAWNGATYTATDVTYNDSFLNLAGRKAFGVDLGLGFRYNKVLGGVLKWNAEITRLINIEEEPYPDGGIQELEGTSGNPLWRAKLMLHWQGDAMTHYAAVQYVGRWDIVDGNGEAFYSVDPYAQLDYQAGYAFNAGHRVVLGVQNVTDEAPPTSAFSWPFFNRSLYSALGRTVSLEWQGRF
ncbi:TonB-dependent receptor [Permianibacter sp. IMCC34836]|uniref:TonB-dependent receptor plug domain-containing protein n=1 Tax=Permianibacter fluminis TaxID=2738515 RepID=UPI001557E92E|nr:TonB-dependent receptor [Permianibacter fluminis]NQD36453.1 TonB-dependent receptor [Permianibacter fluminis]